jgi:hypothetical protein
MKVLVTTVLLLGIASSVNSANKPTTTAGFEYSEQEDLVERRLQGKKSDMSVGKKGGTNDGKKGDSPNLETVISHCKTTVTQSGRYILNSNLNCDLDQLGIQISADDVHLDCQGNKIMGGSNELSDAAFGIGITGAEHVTVSNCMVSNFNAGLRADLFRGFWTDLTVRDSTFSNNAVDGMYLIGNFGHPPSEFTVVNSVLNENGNEAFGNGIEIVDAKGSVYSSTLNNNIGIEGGGVTKSGSGRLTLIDVTVNGNLIMKSM